MQTPPRFRIREANPICDNFLTTHPTGLALHLHSIRIMQMAAAPAVEAAGSKSLSSASTAATSPRGFAAGFEKLLAAGVDSEFTSTSGPILTATREVQPSSAMQAALASAKSAPPAKPLAPQPNRANGSPAINPFVQLPSLRSEVPFTRSAAPAAADSVAPRGKTSKTDRAGNLPQPASARLAAQVDPSATAPLAESGLNAVAQPPAQKLEAPIAGTPNESNDAAVPSGLLIVLPAAGAPLGNLPLGNELAPAPQAAEPPVALHPRQPASPARDLSTVGATTIGSADPVTLHLPTPKPDRAAEAPETATSINPVPPHRSEMSPVATRSSKSPTHPLANPTIADLGPSHVSAHAAASAEIPTRDQFASVTPRAFPTLQPSAVPQAERNTFEALDATAAPPATWIHAGAHHAEAGYLDPSLGWVSVRADANPAGLHAAIVPASPEAASAISTHLAGLNAYLAEHHGHSATATLAPESGDSSASQSGNSMAREQGHSQQPDQNGSQPAQRSDSTKTLPTIDNSATGLRILPLESGVPALNGIGAHLSVLA